MPERRIAHVITGLETGGAEMMLMRLLGATDRTRWRPEVISLRGRGPLADRLAELDVPVATLDLRRSIHLPRAIWRLQRALGQLKPSLLQGWMYHGNLAALLGRAFLPRQVPVVWNVRYTPDDLRREKPGTAAAIRWGARFSRMASWIIHNSHTGAQRHAQLGYAQARSSIVPNGFDTDRFVPSRGSRSEWRARIGAAVGTIVIGRIARYHPMKDHTTFLQAAAFMVRQGADVHFVLAGEGVDGRNLELTELIARLGIEPIVSLLGNVRAVHELNAALDIACSSSAYGEAFPNVLGEAMACGVPCVTTDVGDAAVIVGQTGLVVRPKDPEAMAIAFRQLIDVGEAKREAMGADARARILKEFSLQRALTAYEEVCMNLLAGVREGQ